MTPKRTFLKGFNLFALVLFSTLAGFTQNQPIPQSGFRDGSPVDHLPPYVRMVSGFGERPDWSHDGKRILFVEKPMGEVFELELATGLITPKTRHFNHYGFTRALYLSNGDILLAGPVEPFDPTDREQRERARDLCWLSVLDQSGAKKPAPLHAICAEGPAISRHKLRIAWTERDRQIPDLGKNQARILEADIVYENGIPRLSNQKVIFDSHQLFFHFGNASLETQNYIPPDDTKLIFTVYQIEDGNNTDAYLLDTQTGDFRNLTNSPGYYDEPEGVFPDGLYTCVEHGPSKTTAWPLLDLFKLKLDGSGDMQRLTYFSDFKNYKATQGVVSDDGKFLCFQIGKAGDEAGVGYGFFVMDLKAAAADLGPFQNFSEGEHPLQAAANRFEKAWQEKKPLPALSQMIPQITLRQAYDVQRAWVQRTMKAPEIGGVKAGMVSPGVQQMIGIQEPIAGVLRGNGRLEAAENTTIRLKDFVDLKLETEIGFVIGKRIDQPITTIEQFKKHVSGIIPAIELPAGQWEQPAGKPNPADLVAINVNSAAYIVGKPVAPDQLDARQIHFTFSRNGKELHQADGTECWKGPWETGLWLVQFAQQQGITLEPGQIIICGALGQIHPAKKGNYLLDAGELGSIRFKIN